MALVMALIVSDIAVSFLFIAGLNTFKFVIKANGSTCIGIGSDAVSLESGNIAVRARGVDRGGVESGLSGGLVLGRSVRARLVERHRDLLRILFFQKNSKGIFIIC